jgi:hypothetical protein
VASARTWWLGGLGALALGGLAVAALGGDTRQVDIHVVEPGPSAAETTPPPDAGGPSPVEARPAPTLATPTPWPDPPPRWLAFAGAASPELNQVSVEQDLALVREVFGDGGYVLFGAGPGSPSVQVLAPDRPHDPVRAALGELFAPRGGRDSSYRTPKLAVDAAATKEGVLQALRDATQVEGPPLLLWIGGHGRRGAEPREHIIDLWAHGELGVPEIAEVLDAARRPVRIVSTTCFGGGLAELAFAEATVAKGAAPTERCGLFAAPWDLEATGCDPNPDRAAQEGYALHVLHALGQQHRDGTPRPTEALDFDGDGSISLLEAHTRARLDAATADVPTTTSERWLRQVAPTRGEGIEVALPEEEALIRALATQLKLDGREHDAADELDARESQMEVITTELDAATLREDEAYRMAAGDVLARWPVLDDPWHPDFAQTLARSEAAIRTYLDDSGSYAAYLAARDEVDRLGQQLWDARLAAAPYERLARAVETRQLAARLHGKGGADWAHYQKLLACERAPAP